MSTDSAKRETSRQKKDRVITERARRINQSLTCKCGNPKSEGGLSPICKNCGMVMP